MSTDHYGIDGGWLYDYQPAPDEKWGGKCCQTCFDKAVKPARDKREREGRERYEREDREWEQRNRERVKQQGGEQ